MNDTYLMPVYIFPSSNKSLFKTGHQIREAITTTWSMHILARTKGSKPAVDLLIVLVGDE